MANASQICVIGAGPTGLSVVKTCLEYGLSVICYEYRPQIGGLYTGCDPAFSAVSSDGYVFSTVHDALIMNTSKFVSTFTDFPLPKDLAQSLADRRYMTGLEFVEYLNRYAAAFAITDHVQLSTEVVEVRRNQGQDFRALAWEVTVRSSGSSVTKTTRHRHVIIASGFFRKPNIPPLPGMDKTPVEVVHTLNCHNTKKLFSGRRVLVLGGSTSAGDIAQVALKCGAEKVTWALHRKSTDRSIFMIRRHPHGGQLAWDEWLSHFKALYLPVSLQLSMLQRMSVCAFNRRRSAPPCLVEEDRLAVQDVEVLEAAERDGRFSLMAASLDHFSESAPEAVLTDGRIVPADVAALGFGCEPSYPFLGADVLGKDGLGALPLYRHTVPTTAAAWGLYFLYTATHTGADLLATEMEARWLVHEIAHGRLDTEGDRRRLLERTADIDTPFAVPRRRMPFPIVLRAARELCCQPRLWPAVLSPNPWRRRVALAVAIGPWIPQQYRLRGPHACPEVAGQTVVDVAREVMGWRFEVASAAIDVLHLCTLMSAGFFIYRRFS